MTKYRLGQSNFLCDYPNNFKFEKIGNSNEYAIHTYSNISYQLKNFVTYLNNIDTIPNFMLIYNGKNRYLYDKYEEKLIDLVGSTNVEPQSGGLSQIARYIYNNNVATDTYNEIIGHFTTDNENITSISYATASKTHKILRASGISDNEILTIKINESIQLEKGLYRIGCSGTMMLTTTNSDTISSTNAYNNAIVSESGGNAFFQINDSIALKIVIGCIAIAENNANSTTDFRITKIA